MTSSSNPPSTRICPLSTITVVSIIRSFVIRSTAPAADCAMLEISWDISSSKEFPSLICGVMVSLTPICSRWMVWKGLTAPAELPALVNEPVTNGTSWPTFRLASSLSVVTIEGVEIMFVSALPSRARSTAAKLTPLSEIRPRPKVMPSPISPVGSISPPLPAAAPSCTTPEPKSGKLVTPSGVFEPVPSTAQVMPSSAVLSAITSTMIASTRTCARRMSSRSTICISERMVFGGALITNAFVCVSAQTLMSFSLAGAAPWVALSACASLVKCV